MNCSICKYEHGQRIDFINGGTCNKCSTVTPVPIAVYTHDSVDDDEEYWHHLAFEAVAACPNCGHSTTTTKVLCKDLNTLSEEQQQTKKETA